MTETSNSGNAAAGAITATTENALLPRASEAFDCQKAIVATTPISFTPFLVRWSMAFAVSFAVTWAYVAACPMAFLARTYPDWIAKQAMLSQCALGSVAVFGDSRTVAAVSPRAMTVPVTNFALSGTSPVETYFMVRRALACPTPPKLVVIAHGALKFGGDSDYWNFSARTGFLDFNEMRSVDRDANLLHDNAIQLLASGDHLSPWLRDWMYSVRFPTLYFNSLVHGYVAGRWRHNVAAEQDNLRSSGHALFGTADGSSDVAGEAYVDQFRVSPLIDLYFTRTMALLAARHVPVLLVSMPINETTYRRSSPALSTQFIAYLRMRTAGFGHVTTLGPGIPCWPDNYFGDGWHFNALGAATFSRELSVLLSSLLSGASAIPPFPDRCSDLHSAQSDAGTTLRPTAHS